MQKKIEKSAERGCSALLCAISGTFYPNGVRFFACLVYFITTYSFCQYINMAKPPFYSNHCGLKAILYFDKINMRYSSTAIK